jgi:hypothetical protein
VLAGGKTRHRSDAAHISASYIERQNLTVRMSLRRVIHLTDSLEEG